MIKVKNEWGDLGVGREDGGKEEREGERGERGVREKGEKEERKRRDRKEKRKRKKGEKEVREKKRRWNEKVMLFLSYISLDTQLSQNKKTKAVTFEVRGSLLLRLSF